MGDRRSPLRKYPPGNGKEPIYLIINQLRIITATCETLQKLYMVPRAGIEPARMFYIRGILNPLRLPVSPPGHFDLEAEAGIEPAYTALQAAA